MASDSYSNIVRPRLSNNITSVSESNLPEYRTHSGEFAKVMLNPMNAAYRTKSWWEDPKVTGKAMKIAALMTENIHYDGYILLTAKEISEYLGMQISHTSSNIRILVEAGLIQKIKQRIINGKIVKYRFNPNYVHRGRWKPVVVQGGK